MAALPVAAENLGFLDCDFRQHIGRDMQARRASGSSGQRSVVTPVVQFVIGSELE